MFGMYDRSFINIKSVSELWQKEKKFRIFWIMMIILLLVIVAMSTASLILWNTANIKDGFINWRTQYYVDNNRNLEISSKDANAEWLTILLRANLVPTVVNLAVLGLFIWSVYRSYQEKSFAKLSSLTTFYIAFMALYEGIGLIVNLSQFNLSNKVLLPNSILGILVIITYIIGWIFISSQVSFIRKAFVSAAMAEASEKWMKQFTEQMQQNGTFNPFMSPMGMKENSQQKPTNDQAEQKIDETEIVKTEKDKQIEKLLTLTNSQLYKIAEYLGIFGYKEMSKEELAEKIYW